MGKLRIAYKYWNAFQCFTDELQLAWRSNYQSKPLRKHNSDGAGQIPKVIRSSHNPREQKLETGRASTRLNH